MKSYMFCNKNSAIKSSRCSISFIKMKVNHKNMTFYSKTNNTK